jgi:hypothetical protein
MKKSSFFINDRVAVYGMVAIYGRGENLVCHGMKVRIKVIHPSGFITGTTSKNLSILFHPKQCRKLKPKKQYREIWIPEWEEGLGGGFSSKEECEWNCNAKINHFVRAVKFREVKE